MHRNPRPWLVLGAVVTSTLMMAVDATILALALPAARTELTLGPATTTWVMAGYVLAAGALMIPAGRIGQAIGHRRLMTIGLVVFGIASLAGTLAHEGWVLVAARIGQGVAAAAITPSAMSRLSAAFPGESRARAYGVFGMVMGTGTALGVLLGGLLTELGGWRLCMGVNLLFVAVALVLGVLAHDDDTRSPGHGRGAWRGLVLAAGAGAVVHALTVVERPLTAGAFAAAGTVLVVAFVALDRRSRSPLVPSVLFASPDRRAAYGGLTLWGIATIASFVAASRVLQSDLGIAPVLSGLLFLGYPIAIQLGLLATRRLPAIGTRARIIVGLVAIAVGQAVLATGTGSAAIVAVLVGLACMGLGTSQLMPTASSAMSLDAGPHTGVASAIGTTLQQLGGAVGLALPVALAPISARPDATAQASVAVLLLVGAAALALAPVVRRRARRAETHDIAEESPTLRGNSTRN